MADRKPDAIRVPKTYKNAGGQHAQAKALEAEFGPVLGAKVLHFNSQSGPFVFFHTALHENLYFPKHGEREGQSRYDWEAVEGKEGVEYGYLVEGAKDA